MAFKLPRLLYPLRIAAAKFVLDLGPASLFEPVIHGCNKASSAVIRLLGSNVNNRSIKFLAVVLKIV